MTGFEVAARATADGDDLDLARGAVELIESRGYQRGRDLVGALAALDASG